MKPTAKIKLGLHATGGSVVVDGHDIASQLTAVTVHSEAGRGSEAEVRFLVAETEFDATIRVDDRTRAALLALGWTPPAGATIPATVPAHLTLGDLIARLERENREHPGKRIRIGFIHPHSYRGDYADLAVEIGHDVTIEDMLKDVQFALGQTYEGWKGGDYTMHEHTQVWLVDERGDCGESLGAVLLELLLAQQVTA